MKESVKSGSDKTEMSKKEYQDHLGPMEEPEEQEGGLSDYESSDHSTNSNSDKNDAEEECEQAIVLDGTNVERLRREEVAPRNLFTYCWFTGCACPIH